MDRWLTLLGAVGLAQWLGCASITPAAPTGPHTQADVVHEVPEMPPPPQIEIIPPRPNDRAVWVDGFWRSAGRRWTWQDGSWQEPPAEGAYYARPSLVRIPVPVFDETGGAERRMIGYGMRLMQIDGHWHLPDGSIAPDAAVKSAPNPSSGN